VCKRTPKSFDLSKISENLGKILENPGKNGTQRCFFKKKAPKTREDLFFEITPQKGLDLCGRQFVGKTRKNFSCKFGEIWAKILHTPKNLPAPTPVVSMDLCLSNTSNT